MPDALVSGELSLDRCPAMCSSLPAKDAVGWVVEYWRTGVLPDAGGWRDQSTYFIAAERDGIEIKAKQTLGERANG